MHTASTTSGSAGPNVADTGFLSAELTISQPLDLRLILAPLAHGRGDPTIRLATGTVWRATRTAEGPATLKLRVDGSRLKVAAWGSGGPAALRQVAALVGLHDRPELLDAHHPVLAEVARRHPGVRLPRTGAVLEALLPAILEQKITGVEARHVYRALIAAHGEPAPGPAGLRLPPSPKVLGRLPYHAYHRLGLERRRAEVLRNVALVADRLEETTRLPLPDAYRRLRAISGVGAWTAAEVGRVAYGDPDAISIGDFHVPNLVCWALAGEPRGTDARMLELLEPYRGQRGRVQRLLEVSGLRPPRYGPRMAARRISHL